MSDAVPAPDALTELARTWRRYEADPDGALRAITEAAVAAIGVTRASVWLLDDDRRRLRCVDRYEAGAVHHTSGDVLAAAAYPAYFRALADEEPICADDAVADPRTAELVAGAAAAAGAGAILDEPVRLGLNLVGVVRHEHVGGPRAWTRAEQKDGAFLASLASLALELSQRARREALLTATLESTGEGILASDGARVIAFNRRFLDLWGLEPAMVSSYAQLDRIMRDHTVGTSDLIARANEILVGEEGETVDILELVDGRLLERCSRPQILRGDIVGRVWSFRDVTVQRRSEASLRQLATRDALTGLHNRRAVLALLDAAIAKGDRLAVAVVDIDHFKQINDQHGHLVGDAVLRDFARILAERMRASDVVGRYGGEEFLVVLRGTGAAAARTVVDGIRRGLAARAAEDGIPRYSFSAGVAELGADGADQTALIAAADERLYEAKRAGRDRVV